MFADDNRPEAPAGLGRTTRFRLALLALAASLVLWRCGGSDGSGSGPAASEPPPTVDCSRFPDQRTSAYALPFPVGLSFQVSRTFTHFTTGNGGVGLYAVDFLMPIGTAIHAARSGAVVAVEDRYADSDKLDYHENWIMIRHADASVGRYFHLTQSGARVTVGQIVDQGQFIGLSGNSGPSTAPHLHFDVQTCGPNLPPRYNDLPCGQTLPVSFRNTEAHSCGLAASQPYTALSFQPESR